MGEDKDPKDIPVVGYIRINDTGDGYSFWPVSGEGTTDAGNELDGIRPSSGG